MAKKPVKPDGPRLQLNIRLTPEMDARIKSLLPRVEAIQGISLSVAQLVGLGLVALERETTKKEQANK